MNESHKIKTIFMNVSVEKSTHYELKKRNMCLVRLNEMKVEGCTKEGLRREGNSVN